MNPVRYPYIGNPFGYKLPEPKPIIHPIIHEWNDLPEDQKEELETIKKIIFSIIGECEITLFGSIVKGYWDEDSDYDLVVHKEVSKEIINEIRNQKYPRKVDITFNIKKSIGERGKNILI